MGYYMQNYGNHEGGAFFLIEVGPMNKQVFLGTNWDTQKFSKKKKKKVGHTKLVHVRCFRERQETLRQFKLGKYKELEYLKSKGSVSRLKEDS